MLPTACIMGPIKAINNHNGHPDIRVTVTGMRNEAIKWEGNLCAHWSIFKSSCDFVSKSQTTPEDNSDGLLQIIVTLREIILNLTGIQSNRSTQMQQRDTSSSETSCTPWTDGKQYIWHECISLVPLRCGPSPSREWCSPHLSWDRRCFRCEVVSQTADACQWSNAVTSLWRADGSAS